MLRKTITVSGDTYPVLVQCPRCGRTPLDLLRKMTVPTNEDKDSS